MSFPRYPNYKDSGVEWLGEVPEHWEAKKLRHFANVLRGKFTHRPRNDPAFYDGEFPFVQTGDITGSSRYITGFKQTLNERGVAVSKEFPKGTLVMAIAANIGDVAILDFPAYFPDSIVGLVPKTEVDLMFLYYLMIGMKQPMLMTATVSTQMNLNVDQICSLASACPPREEQTRIAAFLDRETAKIDELVAGQRRLMELLKEKCQAVISHAVTKGLNPHAPMKPSGIEWLGDVPAHWEVGPLKRYWSVTDCKHVTAEFVEDGIPLASIREVQSRWVALENAKCTTEHFYDLLIEGGRCPSPGDLIFSRNATVGEVAQVPAVHPRFAMGQDVVLLRKLSPEYSSDFLQHVIRSPIIVQQLANMMIGSTFKRINVEEIRSFVVPSPPLAEQAEIAAFLEIETAKFDTLVAEARRAIDLLQERRTALISAAVTGQIDVRNHQT